MDKRKSLGYSDRDLSFLLGYRALYVRDVEDPLHTLRYTAKDTNYLLSIFDCKLSEIMADIIAEDFYHIEVKLVDHEDSIIYKIYREVSPKKLDLLREFTYEIQENINNVNDPVIEASVQSLFDNGFFDEGKTAFEVFIACKERLRTLVSPFYVANAIRHYTSRRKFPRLVHKKNKSGRTVYNKVLYL